MKGHKTGGWIKGTPNKATVEIKKLARRYVHTQQCENSPVGYQGAVRASTHRRDQGNP
jgi:hypothetical protein